MSEATYFDRYGMERRTEDNTLTDEGQRTLVNWHISLGLIDDETMETEVY